MKKNIPNSQDKIRNTYNSKNKNVSKECAANKCKGASTCSISNKTVQDIERYTKEAENLVEALSALTKLAEQLKPCIETKSQCSQNDYCKDNLSDASSFDEDQKDVEQEESDVKIPIVEQQPEEPMNIARVRSEPARVKPEEAPNNCVCCCSSLSKATVRAPNKEITFEDDKRKKRNKDSDSDDEKQSCCRKRKSKEQVRNVVVRKEEKPVKENVSKQPDEIIELKPLPMPRMTVVHPEEDQRREIQLHPTLLSTDPQIGEKVTVYPTVPATTTKAAMNLEDKETQAGESCMAHCQMGCNTEAVHIKSDKEGCSVCCQVSCGLDGNVTMQDEVTGTTLMLNAIPFEEYAEKDFHEYWYDDAVQCKCSTPTEKPSTTPTPQTSQCLVPKPPPPQLQDIYIPAPTSMMEYPYYNSTPTPHPPTPNYQDGQSMPAQYRQFPQFVTQSSPDEYSEYNRSINPKGQKQMNSDVPVGFNVVNFDPHLGGVVHKACKTKGSVTDSQNQQGFEDIDCEPSCASLGTKSSGYVANSSAQPQIAANKKIVQYQDQPQYDYCVAQPQPNYKYPEQQMRYIKDQFPPCQYENAPQRSTISRRGPENNPNNRSAPNQQESMQRDIYQRQLNSLMHQPHNTLNVGKANKDMQESINSTGKATSTSGTSNAPKPGPCSGSCQYQNNKQK